MQNDYGRLVEAWKVELIVSRARRMGFRQDELEDVQQELIQAMLAFRYDPRRANGATERTALTALVDKRLKFIKRGRGRRYSHEKKYRAFGDIRERKTPENKPTPLKDDAASLALDVQATVANLTPRQQAVCAALANGESRANIARSLGASRYEVDQLINHIRKQFKAHELDAWMGSEARGCALGETTSSAALLTADELASVLRVHRRQIYKLVSSGHCPPPLKIGKSSRWQRTQIERWIEQGCRPGAWDGPSGPQAT